MGKQAPPSEVVQHTIARDKDGEDVTGLWVYYHRLRSQVILYGHGSQVPKPIDAPLTDKYSNSPCIVIR
eukprot:12932513-Prorocentrum_lima.AAC.1